MTYEIAPYSSRHDAQIAALQTTLWSPDEALNLRYLKWKYRENPYFDDIVVRLALYDGQAVAMRGIIGSAWEHDGGPPELLPCAEDFVVAPEHRNRGVARAVHEALLEDAEACGYRYALSLTAAPVTFVSSIAAGWRFAGRYRAAWRQRVASTRWSRRRARWRKRLGMQWRPFTRLDRVVGRRTGNVRCAREPRTREMAALIERLPSDGRIRHVRDEAYFDWRLRNPHHDYRFLYWGGDELEGYLVLKFDIRNPQTARIDISDWEATSDRVREGLLLAALERCPDVNMLVWAGSEPELELLHRHGFVTRDTGPVSRVGGLLVHGLGASRDSGCSLGGRNLLDIEDWDLRLLYCMVG